LTHGRPVQTFNRGRFSVKIMKPSTVVMAGLDPTIPVPPSASTRAKEGVDHRVEPGDDD
jgi:hypothetical protein